MLTKSMVKETELNIKEVGLCVNPSLPHLGASLDRMVYDPKSSSKKHA